MTTETLLVDYAADIARQSDELLCRNASQVLEVNPEGFRNTTTGYDRREFVRSVCAQFRERGSITPPQRAAIARIMLQEHLHRARVATAGVPTAPAARPIDPARVMPNSAPVRAMLDRAVAYANGRGLRRPMIRVARPGGSSPIGSHIRFVRSSMDPHGVYVTVGNGAARGSQIGLWTGERFVARGTGRAFDEARDIIRALGDSPAERLAVLGRQSGACCFCGRPLTDPRSIAHGYGPVCAEHYSLPWVADRDAAEAAQTVDITAALRASDARPAPAPTPRLPRSMRPSRVPLRTPGATTAPAHVGPYNSGEE